MVDQMNRWIHSGQGFIGSFDLPWSEWLGSLILIRIIPNERTLRVRVFVKSAVTKWTRQPWHSPFKNIKEFNQRRFWATHVDRKWTFYPLELRFWRNFSANRLFESKEVHTITYFISSLTELSIFRLLNLVQLQDRRLNQFSRSK